MCVHYLVFFFRFVYTVYSPERSQNMDRIIEISSVFVDLFNSFVGNPAAIDDVDIAIPVQLQEITENYIQRILTACCSQQGTGLPGFQSGSTVGSSGLRVNEFKRSEYTFTTAVNLNTLLCYIPIFFFFLLELIN